MQNNTVVTASDSNYVWGVFLLIASMRKTGMDEPIIILSKGYTQEDNDCLSQFDGVKLVDFGDTNSRNMTTSKPVAMLYAETDYTTWADCDGVFIGNCSELLTEEEGVHFRLRSKDENYDVFKGRYGADDTPGEIPKKILDIWRRDIGENSEPLFDTCGSACYLSVHKKYRYALEKWRDQMEAVMPDDDVGVVDKRSEAYFQTDESVLNSVLMFTEGVKKPGEYKLNKDPEAHFMHFISVPKPWQMWNKYGIAYFDRVVDIVDWAVENSYRLPKGNKIPFSLQRKYKLLIQILARFSGYYASIKKRL